MKYLCHTSIISLSFETISHVSFFMFLTLFDSWHRRIFIFLQNDFIIYLQSVFSIRLNFSQDLFLAFFPAVFALFRVTLYSWWSSQLLLMQNHMIVLQSHKVPLSTSLNTSSKLKLSSIRKLRMPIIAVRITCQRSSISLAKSNSSSLIFNQAFKQGSLCCFTLKTLIGFRMNLPFY